MRFYNISQMKWNLELKVEKNNVQLQVIKEKLKDTF